MKKVLRVMTENPMNAQTDPVDLRSWVTSNTKFFCRNQSQMLTEPLDLEGWQVTIDGEVRKSISFTYEEIRRMPKVTVANTMECSGNGRALLKKKARGNPWTIGGVGNAVWGGVWLGDLLRQAGLGEKARHVAFEGVKDPSGKARIKFVRSVPIAKALESTLLAYEMNGETLPPEHGFPLRGLPLGWTGANCVKWLERITVMDHPYEGHFMDTVYRVFREGEKSTDGEYVTSLPLKSIITQPLSGDRIALGEIVILGNSYGGDSEVARVELSTDGGSTWEDAQIIGPQERWAWRQWQFVWHPAAAGEYRIMARATDTNGIVQPMEADWNVLGYGNNGVNEHAITVTVE